MIPSELLPCGRCGITGVHACTGTKIEWTPEEIEKLMQAMNELFNKQEPLGHEFEKVLYDNLEDLYDANNS